MKALAVPPDRVVPENRKTSFGIMAASAVLTVTALAVLAAYDAKVMAVSAGIGFAALLTRFVWLVWRELD
ncbi:MAG: hypothetical protein JNL35_00475 [Sphingopyxis sp.]|nr:hypothetical protein [Sphingopyxis sp.]